ncbi:MAG TPA: maltotransferase domain-containing protein, partial [Acidimicrobiales bacterium]|nr:maltotransferase domain-containing protein [Acidimicrobiales bacterium]
MPPRRPSASVADAPGTLVIVEAIEPAVAGGFPAKAIVGDQITVSADVFTHGHDLVRAWLRHRPIGGRRWVHVPMSALGNDRFSGSFTPGRAGLHEVEVIGAPDDIASWLRDAERRHAAGRDDPLDMEVGRELLARAASEVSAAKGDGGKVADAADRVGRAVDSASLALVASLSGELARRLPPADQTATVGGRILVTAARQRAGFSTWYELFPRSASPDPGRPGTLTDVVARIPYVVELGFD